MVSAAVRLGAAGPLEGQRLLAWQREEAESVLVATAGLPPEAAASAAPILDLLQAHQDRLYSRLFQS
jgi:urease accessory protein